MHFASKKASKVNLLFYKLRTKISEQIEQTACYVINKSHQIDIENKTLVDL